jgi:acyl carrier protein
MMPETTSIQTPIIEFLSHRIAVADTLAANTPIIQSGLLDSLTLLDLVQFIERQWGVRLSARDINSTNFRDVDTLTSVICQRLTSAAARTEN